MTGMSLALGTSPVTLLEMVNAYSTIAAQGEYRKPLLVSRISDRSGKVIDAFGGEAAQRGMSGDAAATLIDMMRGVVNSGTGTDPCGTAAPGTERADRPTERRRRPGYRQHCTGGTHARRAQLSLWFRSPVRGS